MYAKGEQKPTVGPGLGSTELCVLALKPMFIDLPGVMGDWLQLHICNVFCTVVSKKKKNYKKKKRPGILPLSHNWKVKDFDSFVNKDRVGVNLKITSCTTFF